LAICDLEFGIWDFSHLAVLGELGGLISQDQNKKNKTENGHWSLVVRDFYLSLKCAAFYLILVLTKKFPCFVVKRQDIHVN